MSLALIIMLGFWAVIMGTALLVARSRLGYPGATLRDELLGRGVAFLAASVALFGFGLAATLLTTTSLILAIAPPIWIVSVAPLFIPPLRRGRGDLLISSETWVMVSIVVTVAGGLAMALYVLLRLLLMGPELV